MIWFNQLGILGLGILLSAGTATAAQWDERVLENFRGGNGIQPTSGVTLDAAGNLYGTTFSGGKFDLGTAFKLSPPTPGQSRWGQTILHRFGDDANDGTNPTAGLVMDAAGNLFGTTEFGGARYGGGTVFELAAPTAGQTVWNKKTIHSFDPFGGRTGYNPTTGVTLDAAGNIYGVLYSFSSQREQGSGTVYELSPSAGGGSPWRLTILYLFPDLMFPGPSSALTFDAKGNLYGETAYGGARSAGTVFRLSPPAAGSTTWTETTLISFLGSGGDCYDPSGGLTFDAQGNLYGTCSQGGQYQQGMVFEITPPADGQTAWTELIPHSFGASLEDGSGGSSGVVIDQAGNLYGTTQAGGELGNGVVFKLSPVQGQGDWPEQIVFDFPKTNGYGGRFPSGPLTMNANGKLFGTTTQGGRGACSSGGAIFGCGTVFQLQP